MDESEDTPLPARAKPSATPSWVMLGFVLGALAALALPRAEKTAAPPPVAPPRLVPPEPVKPAVDRAKFFEDVFAEYSGTAIWQDDRTEVAFWNDATRAFSDCFEVLKVGDKFYFRSIPRLTRPVLTKDVSANSPLQFTVPVDAKFLRSTPTFDELNHGVFPRAVEPARVTPPVGPPGGPEPIKPVIEPPAPEEK